ncbi:MAG: hypothetical protein ACE5OZ_01690 [Candidatus Heimdallarchaeota archaeon]
MEGIENRNLYQIKLISDFLTFYSDKMFECFERILEKWVRKILESYIRKDFAGCKRGTEKKLKSEQSRDVVPKDCSSSGGEVVA